MDAFSRCSGLISITIPNSVTTIGNEAFKGCSSMTLGTIGNSVNRIGYEAFRGCTGLTSVTIGNSVANIGVEAFAGCASIRKLTSCASTPPICFESALKDINKDICKLIVPVGTTAAYKAALQWKDFYMIEEADVTAIDDIINDETASEIIGIYDINGNKFDTLQRGINIIKMRNGTTKKVLEK